MPIFKSIKPGTSLKNIINYVSKEFKQTQDTDTIKGVNVADNPNIATLQMLNTKNSFGKEEGRQYQHYILSFSTEEKISVKEAIDYAEKHAKECFGDRHEVFLAAHQNSEGSKLHVHYIVNSVSFIDGLKIQTSRDDYEKFKDLNDEIAKEHGFKIIDRSFIVSMNIKVLLIIKTTYWLIAEYRLLKRCKRILKLLMILKALCKKWAGMRIYVAKI